MKVLQINSVCGYGSTGRIATDLYKVLEEQGHECVIAYGRGTAPEGIKTIKIGSKLDNYAHVAKTRLFDKHGFGSVRSTKEFIEQVKEYDPDIIHLHNIHGYYINIEILFNYLKVANKPVIWTLHDCWSFTGHCAYFDYVKCNRWIDQCNDCPQNNSYPKSLFIDNSEMNFIKKREIFTGVKELTLVTPSIWLSELVAKSFLNKYSVKVINNGIDLDAFKPLISDFRKEYDVNDKFIILGIASKWDRRKGLEYFLRLSSDLDSDECIILVGVSNEVISELPSNIIGINRISNINELAEIYSSSDVYVNPTLEDNFPTTNIESLACGTPVITFSTGGSMESIDNNTGFVVEKGNYDELLNKIRDIKITTDIDYKKNCVSRSYKFYDKCDKAREYLYLYNLYNN